MVENGGMRAHGAASPSTTKVGRNDPCPCGSGRKHKQCCYGKDAGAELFYATTATPSPRGAAQALRESARRLWNAQRFAEAAVPFHEITRLEPDNAQAHYDFGLSLLRCGRLPQAVASLERALQLKPGFVGALAQLAFALEEGGRGPESLLAYRKLVRMADNAPDRMFYSAKVLALEGKLDEAEDKLRRLIALAPERTGTRMVLAKLLLDRGLFDRAEVEMLQAIDTFPSAFERLTSIRRMTEADRRLIARMQALVDSAGFGGESRIAVGFGLGRAFSDLGDYAEAMRYYEMANDLRAATTRLNREALARRYDDTIARYGRDALDRAAGQFAGSAASMSDLPVFIVGMPRSGTTLTEQIVSSHPAVAAAGELPFWSARLAALTLSREGLPDAAALARSVDDYLGVLRGVRANALRVTNKQPLNFELLWLIRLAFPEARIIHCRRNPIDTCLSIYFSYFWGHQEYAFDRGDLVFQYRQYERLMAHWRSVVPSDRFLEVDYETLTADTEAETRRLVAFLGLAWDEACLAPERNERVIKTASVWQARQPVYKTSVERWRRYEPWLGELRELIPRSASSQAAVGD